ncbi:hypothetical protein SpCBS45565_g00211 [Spizellomyces sp. 'palustris']|nr:hypothetical protein SpCBS45565_g00211 [Spizellomyces sp. 'palustris']
MEPSIPSTSEAPQSPREIFQHTDDPVRNGSGKKKKLTEIERLELDNQRMEERLNALRETLARQKEKRASANKSSVWRGGQLQKGTLNSYAADVLAKKNAALQRSRYAGIGREADERRKHLETTIKSVSQASPGALPTQPREQPMETKSRRGSEATPPTYQIKPQPPPQPLSPPPTGMQNARPPRMWRVPSALGHYGVPPSPAPPPTLPRSTNPLLTAPTSARRQSEGYTSPRRSSEHYTSTRRGSDTTVIAIPPTPPRDSDSARDDLFSAVEEGRNDVTVSFGSSPPASDSVLSDHGSKDSLLDGSFDEEASHKSFVQALEEWRKEAIPENSKSLPPSGISGNRRASVSPVRVTKGSAGASPEKQGRVPNDDDLFLPTHNERSSPAHSRPRAGSLATIGKSISSLTTTLGAALGIGGGGNATGVPSRYASDSTSPVHTSVPDIDASPSKTRSDTTLEPHALDGHQTSLLDGGYDESESHRSFLAALNRWRRVQEGDEGYIDVTGKRTATESNEGRFSISTATETPARILPSRAAEAAESAFAQSANGLTYMERLLLGKYRHDLDPSALDVEQGDGPSKNHEGATIKSANDNSTVQKSLQTSATESEGSLIEGTDPDDDPTALPVTTTASLSYLTSIPKTFLNLPKITIEDVTENEEAALMANGNVVECVGSDKLVIQEPDDEPLSGQ